NIIKLEIDDGVTTGVSDASRLGQCVFNLLSNAAKFTSDGVIAVRAARTRRDDADWLVIAVEDTGIGIAPERQPVLFEPFVQAHTAGEGKAKGEGLGLAPTRRLALLVGGDVSSPSTPKKGSRFTLEAPLELRVESAPTRETPPAEIAA